VYTSKIGLALALTERKVWVAGKTIYRANGFARDLEPPAHLPVMLDQAQWDERLGGTEVANPLLTCFFRHARAVLRARGVRGRSRVTQ